MIFYFKHNNGQQMEVHAPTKEDAKRMLKAFKYNDGDYKEISDEEMEEDDEEC